VDVVDDLTFRINLKQPFAPLLAQFTDRAGMMVSPKAAERLGDKFASAPVCAGPFKFVERVPQDRIVVERFPDYWNKDAIHIQRIEFRPIPDATVRLTNLRAGQLDLVERLAPTDVPQVKRDAKLKLDATYELGFQEVLFNPNKAGSPVADPKVRAAFEAAIDRNAINQVVYNGEFLAGNQWVNPKNPNYVAEYPIPKRDVAKAKALLAEAGFPNGFSTTLSFPTSGSGNMIPIPMNEALQKDLAKVGIKVQLQPIEWGAMLGDFFAGKIPGGADGINISLGFVLPSLWKTWFGTGASANVGKYSNPEADRLMNAIGAELDAGKRVRLYQQLNDVLLKDAPWLLVVNDLNPRVLAPNVKGFVQPRSWYVDLTHTWVQ
jgi:peptide/nickel transport system substrate-binding protein